MSLPVLSPEHMQQLQAFETQILANQTKIEAWFRTQWSEHKPPFYGSVDIRNAGYKMASIDMNLFPGGFNNLNPQFIPLAALAAQDALDRACETAKSVLIVPENHTRNCETAKSVLIVPENHTRNTFYLQNVFALSHILRSAGFEVRLGSLNPEITEPTEFTTAGGDTLLLEPLLRTRGRVHLADGFSPCVVLLNNDLSGGVPDILKDLQQTVVPPLHAGWTTRRKTAHFAAYNQVAAEFAKLINIDEWQINPYFEQISGLDFQEREGEDALADAVIEACAVRAQPIALTGLAAMAGAPSANGGSTNSSDSRPSSRDCRTVSAQRRTVSSRAGGRRREPTSTDGRRARAGSCRACTVGRSSSKRTR